MGSETSLTRSISRVLQDMMMEGIRGSGARLERYISRAGSALVALGLLSMATPAAMAQQPDTIAYDLSPVVVTATRTVKPVFITPAPVNLFDAETLRESHAHTITDLFRDVPGLDIAGVGVQQPRPIIRGQRGQRILLLQDDLRLNNSRRQQDFGEIPALSDISSVERVEVVRGPSSVLYGTDAIGGVVNIITRAPEAEGIHGNVGYGYGSAADLHRGTANLFGRFGAWDVQFNAAIREAGEYSSPGGEFGAIRLDPGTRVAATGVSDRTLAGRVGYRFSPRHSVHARGEHYRAQDAGFGFVDPAAYAPDEAAIDIRYPDQTFRKLTLGYTGTDLGTPLADRAELIGYRQDNLRDVVFSLDQQLGGGASIDVTQYNFSDLATTGMRLEAAKLVQPGLLLTYGADAFRDRSVSTDSSVTLISGFGPPQTHIDRVPQVPNATFQSVGAFLQGEFTLGAATLVLGGRVQEVGAETRETEGLEETFQSRTNRTVVGSASAIYALTERFSLLGSVGRGFRSPNLIEWFYEGLSTDGRYFQARNPELTPETSLNFDGGLRFRNEHLQLEGFLFRNRIQDGIRTVPTEETVNNRTVYRNVNIDELVFRGVEVDGALRLPHRFTLSGGFAWQEAEDARDANIPVGDLYSSKATGALRYDAPGDRVWLEYGVRHQGEQSEAVLVDNPIGDVLPAFTVHNLRGGVTLFERGSHTQRLGITIGNLADRLYAETSNASFFRPEPGRHLILSWEASF